MNSEIKFERSVREFNRKLKAIKEASQNFSRPEISKSVQNLEDKARNLEEEYYNGIDRWNKVKISRTEGRPQILDYIPLIFDEFIELKGDRSFGDDPAVVGGFAEFEGLKVMLMGNQKGRGLNERLDRNFGMPHPEGYRKAVRLMEMAERFGFPLVTMVDTPGAYPGVEAEARGQSEAIARCLLTMSTLTTPIVSVILGEGGSGGALALGVADIILMLENANFSVVSPEGCASILWKDSKMKREAAESLKSTAQDNLELGLIDEIIPEPLGGAHRDPDVVAMALKEALKRHIMELKGVEINELLKRRYRRFREIGVFNRGSLSGK